MSIRQRSISIFGAIIAILGSLTLLLVAGAVLRPLFDVAARAIWGARPCG